MATRTVSNTGGNWNATATWVGGVVPIAGDTVNFTATSGNLTVNVGTANLAGIDFTNYVGTITVNNTLNVTSGTINLGTGGYTQNGASGFGIGGSVTIISNGTVWSRIITFLTSSSTTTLSDNLTVTGNIIFQSAVSFIINGNTLFVGSNLTMAANGLSGTTNIIFNGTGTWVHTSAGAIRNNVTINTAGTLTIGTNIYYNTGTLTYVAGTVTTTGSTLNILASTTLDTSGMTWNNIRTNNIITLTLLSNLNTTNLYLNNVLSFTLNGNNLSISGTLILGYTTGATTFNTPQNLQVTNLLLGNGFASNQTLNGLFTISISGNLTENHGTGLVSGTTSILLNGTGTWSNASTGALQNNLTINTAGTITISGNVYYSTGTLTYTAGTVTTTGSTLNISTSTTLDTSSINWNNVLISISTNITLTLLSDFNITGTFDYLFSGANIILSFLGTGLFNPIGNFIIRQGGFFNGTINLPNILNLKNFTASSITGFTTTINNYNINISGNLTNNNQGTIAGTTNLFLVGTGIWSNTIDGRLQNNLTINTSGTITFSSTVYYQIGTLTYLSGKIETSGNTFYLGTSTLINCHKINFNRVVVGAGTTLTMNEFFSGSANLKTTISSTGANYNISFQDGFEKISKFVNISGATISIRNQLLVITNSKKSSTNLGIRYINQSPNGVPKGDPSVQNTMTPGLGTFLVGDPTIN